MTDTLQTYLEFATETAYLAGKLTLGYFQTGVRPDMKADDTPVTVADRGAEELVRARIEQRFPGLRCRAIAAQFMDDQVVAMFELALDGDEVKVVEERHYRLVPAGDLDREAIRSYRD